MSKVLSEDVGQKVRETLKDSLGKIGLLPFISLSPEKGIGALDVYLTRDERKVSCPFSVDTFFGRISFDLLSDVMKNSFYFLTSSQINNTPGCNILDRIYVDSDYEAIKTIVNVVKSHITLLSIIYAVGIPAKSFTNTIWETDHGGLYDFAIKSELLMRKSIPLIVDLSKISLFERRFGFNLWICFDEFDEVNRKPNRFASIRLFSYVRPSWEGGSKPNIYYRLEAVRKDFHGEDTTDRLDFIFKTWEEAILALFKERVGEKIRNLIEVSYQKMY